jgi:predicted 2-oxoglutarate/Fe(II)-dependent dioxygenase YbiX
MTTKIGKYEIRFSEEEKIGVNPKIFFQSKTDQPVVHRPGFLNHQETQYFYQNAMLNYQHRLFATVHDYTKGVNGSRVDADGRYTHYIPVGQEVYDALDKKLEEEIFPLISKNYDIGAKKLKRAEGWQFLGYGEGFFFVNHCDNCVPSSYSTDPSQQKFTWWNNTPNRKFTVLMYLNDQSDDYSYTGTYSGGDLTLNRIFDETGSVYRVKPTAGTLITFPSNFLYNHEVHKVKRGYRFCIVTWLDVSD